MSNQTSRSFPERRFPARHSTERFPRYYRLSKFRSVTNFSQSILLCGTIPSPFLALSYYAALIPSCHMSRRLNVGAGKRSGIGACGWNADAFRWQIMEAYRMGDWRGIPGGVAPRRWASVAAQRLLKLQIPAIVDLRHTQSIFGASGY